MTRAPKRKVEQESSPSAKKHRVDSVRSGSFRVVQSTNKVAAKFLERIDELYTKYTDVSLGMIDPEGIETLCKDLKTDPSDVRILMLAWKMGAEKQGYFTQEEWRRGLNALRVDTMPKFKKALQQLDKEVLESENFDGFYAFAFRYCLTEEKQKCLDIETTCVLIDLVLGLQYRTQVNNLIEFLKVQSEYKAINMDQWTNFLRFCQEMNFAKFEDYDTSQAWPLILDNFVEWMKNKDT